MNPDPNWPRASEWLAGDHDPKPVGRLAVLGAPLRLGSISGGRFDLAPEAIRRALDRYSTWTPRLDVRSVAASDLGDVAVADLQPEEAREPISTAVREAIGTSDAAVILGGDNSVTRPSVLGLGVPLHRVGLLTLDAHFDLRDTDNGLTNGNPIRALLEDGLPGENIVQIGIQAFANSSPYTRVAEEAGIQWTSVRDAVPFDVHAEMAVDRLATRVEAVYVDLDVDVLDRAYAPACPGSRPGGTFPDEAADAAWRLGKHPKVRAMDIVEVDPTQDVADVTVLTAASFLLSFAAGLAERGRGET